MSLTPGRARRTAGLIAALAALVAVPAAEAAGVRVSGDTLIYSADGSTERNRLRLSAQGGEFIISDSARLTPGAACRAVLSTLVQCAGTPTRATMDLGPGNDRAAIATGIPVSVGGGSGDDLLTDAGRPSFPTAVTFHGEAGFDSVSYFNATSGVEVNLNAPGDGRPGDRDDVRGDVELINGSQLADTITGNELDQTIAGSRGNDTVSGLGGNDTFIEDSRPNGADTIFGGSGLDTLDLTRRTNGVTVRLDGARASGEPGEGDTYSGDTELVRGGSGGDTFTGTDASNFLIGGAGDDTLSGGGNFDQLTGGPGVDTINGGSGDDMTFSGDGGRDIVFCGSGDVDRAFVDRDRTLDAVQACEEVLTDSFSVGRVAIAPRNLVVGRRRAQLRVAWRHPFAWTQLDEVLLRVRDGDRTVARIRIDQETRSVRARGSAVELLSDGTSVAGRQGGATMTARLVVRIARRYAGRTLTAQVAAVDDDGTRQSFRTVGRIRVR